MSHGCVWNALAEERIRGDLSVTSVFLNFVLRITDTESEELKVKNEIYVVYDFGSWNDKAGRYVYGRKVSVKRVS